MKQNLDKKIDLTKKIEIVDEFIRLKVGKDAGVPDREPTDLQKMCYFRLQHYRDTKKLKEVHKISLFNFFEDMVYSMSKNIADCENWILIYKEA